ncbi:MAG: exodeoxyribonuclease VII large subunit, partial [Phycisphaerales bacterium]|nr:exodeoxyribonuclease VII large subunit [Phycisphaerales bacterium]
MNRLPFDPDRLPDRAPDADPASDERPMSVTDLAGLIKRVLEGGVESPVHVIGEVSNLSARGHWFFSLKDDDAVVSCVAWASTAARFGFVPADGDEVVASGHVSHYEPQGRTQLYVRTLRPVGAG